MGMVREEVVGVGVEGFASPSASLGFGLGGQILVCMFCGTYQN